MSGWTSPFDFGVDKRRTDVAAVAGEGPQPQPPAATIERRGPLEFSRIWLDDGTDVVHVKVVDPVAWLTRNDDWGEADWTARDLRA